jgi:hypothetical protein
MADVGIRDPVNAPRTGRTLIDEPFPENPGWALFAPLFALNPCPKLSGRYFGALAAGPALRSHTLIVPSRLALARRLPSALNTTLYTSPVCP